MPNSNLKNLKIEDYDCSNLENWSNNAVWTTMDTLFQLRTIYFSKSRGLEIAGPSKIEIFYKSEGSTGKNRPNEPLFEIEFKYDSKGHTSYKKRGVEKRQVLNRKGLAEKLQTEAISNMDNCKALLRFEATDDYGKRWVRYLRSNDGTWEVFATHGSIVPEELYRFMNCKVDKIHWG